MPTRSTRQADRASGAQPAVLCANVEKWFGAFPALSDVSLVVEQGETLALIGPSGAGKSTLLRCLNGLEPHSAGTIAVDGISISNDTRSLRLIRERVGMVFQQFNLFPHFNVLDNVAVPQRVVRNTPIELAREVATAMLARVGMSGHQNKHINQLSGGEQQRVAIARALAMDPKIMLFDEPTSAIDPELTREVLELIRDVAESGMTTLIVTHEMGFVRRVADRIAFFDRGKLIEEGTPSQLLDFPQHRRTRAFLEQVPTLWPTEQAIIEPF